MWNCKFVHTLFILNTLISQWMQVLTQSSETQCGLFDHQLDDCSSEEKLLPDRIANTHLLPKPLTQMILSPHAHNWTTGSSRSFATGWILCHTQILKQKFTNARSMTKYFISTVQLTDRHWWPSTL